MKEHTGYGKFISLFRFWSKLATFSCHLKERQILIGDDDFCHMIFLIGGLSGHGSYKLGGK